MSHTYQPPKNIERLPKIPPNLSPLLQYITLPFPSLPTNVLPQGSEATVDIEFDQIQCLKVAYDLLREPFTRFVSTHSVDWIISDFTAHWLPDIAEKYQVQLMYFSVYSATYLSFLSPPEYLVGEGQKRVSSTPDSMTSPPPWADIIPPSVALHGYEAALFHIGFYSMNASGVTDAERIATMIQRCRTVAIRTCREFEGEYIDLYQTLICKPVLSAGLLPRADIQEKDKETVSSSWDEGFKWLDQQSPKSVIYVGFGSEYKLTKNEVYEIAYGLEISELPFIWALRKPTWAMDDSEALPPGVLTRSSGKGIVWLGWAVSDTRHFVS